MAHYTLVINDNLRRENGEILSAVQITAELQELLSVGYLELETASRLLQPGESADDDEGSWSRGMRMPPTLKAGETLESVKDAPQFVRVTNANGDQFLRRKDLDRCRLRNDCQRRDCRAWFEEPKMSRGPFSDKLMWLCPVCRFANYVE